MTSTREILRTAWAIAREGAAKFGGRPVQYIASAMRQAWAAVKVKAIAANVLGGAAKIWSKTGVVRVYVRNNGRDSGYITILDGELDMSNCRGDTLRRDLRAAGYAW